MNVLRSMQRRRARRVPHDEPAHRDRQHRGTGRAGRGEAERRQRRADELGDREGGGRPDHHPVHEAGDGTPSARAITTTSDAASDRRAGPAERAARPRAAPPPTARTARRRRAAAARRAGAAGTAARGRWPVVRRRAVERRAELVVDRRGERREAQHLQRAELGQQVQRDEQPPPSRAGRSCGRTTRRERRPAAEAERVRPISSNAGSSRAGRGDRQVDEREVRQRDDEDRPGVTLDGVGQRHPGVAVDERRHGERRDEQPRHTRGAAGRCARRATRRPCR